MARRASAVSLIIILTACSPHIVYGNGSGDDDSCPVTAVKTTPSIALLIDRSGSMSDDIGGTSRYDAIREALVDNTDGIVTKLQGDAYFGATLFSNDDPCPRLYAVPRAKANR